mgnify:FL=1|jgi:hypothetical protein
MDVFKFWIQRRKRKISKSINKLGKINEAKKQKIKQSIKKVLKTFGLRMTPVEKKFSILEKEFKLEKHKSNNNKALFTHSFGIYEPSYIHDKLMAYALSLRGFDIHATFCDGIQDIECNVYGGIWGGGNNFKKNCQNCQSKSQELWSFLNPNHIFKYSNYLKQEDYAKIEAILEKIPNDKWTNHYEDGWDIGFWAKDILVNNYVVADYKLIKNHEQLGRSHLKNLLLCKIACEKIIEEMQPDRIISNDSYYGMWKIWEFLAKKHSIPFYSHWVGTRVGGWSYAYNDASMNLDFSPSWENYSKIPLTNDEKNRVEKWLIDRMAGKEMIIDTASLASYKNEDFDLTKIDITKPTALLSANVVWDLAALNKEVFNRSMADWIIETIKWFKQYPEYQLIIKPHPAEFFPGIPETKETVLSMIEKEFSEIPENIFVLSPKVSISVYDLLPLSKVGLVFTTSVGMEMAARGIPVITAGKSHYRGYGFTYDPPSQLEYFEILKNILDNNQEVDRTNMIDLSMKFIKFNFFHYFSKVGLMEFSIGKEKKSDTDIKIDTILQLKKGHNLYFDYVLDCIETGDGILTEYKWMKES